MNERHRCDLQRCLSLFTAHKKCPRRRNFRYGKNGGEDLKRKKVGVLLSGAAAGLVNGLFGAGGGMVLLPLLSKTADLKERELFACSVCIILPLCLVSAGAYWLQGGSFAVESLPYLLGGALGGAAAGLLLKRLPTLWLHRALGAFILWGGVRLLLQ